VEWGIALIASGSLVAVLVVFGLWRRLSTAAAMTILAVCGVVVGAGALLVQERASAFEWALTLVGLGVFAPVHARMVFGPPGAPA
jgi:hypothetical protein